MTSDKVTSDKDLKKMIIVNLAVIIFFIFDRILKFIFIEFPNTQWSTGYDFLSFHFEKNYGIAFGFFSFFSNGFFRMFLLALIALFIIFIFHHLVKAYEQKNVFYVLGFSLIVVGALSNFIDRVRYGFVVDYVNISFFTVFNIADAMISIGVVLLIVYEGFFNKKNIM